MFDTVYVYVPLGSLKVIVVEVEYFVSPASVTDQFVPEDRPDSVNVTAYSLLKFAISVMGALIVMV